jgi:protein-disulfide isomerase-like protein with CxxC motif
VRYAASRFVNDQKDAAYRIYVTDTLRLIAQSTGQCFERRFVELLDEANGPPEITKSGEEIAADVIARAGLVVI